MSERVGTGLDASALRDLRELSACRKHLPMTVAGHCGPSRRIRRDAEDARCGQFSYFTAHPGVTRGDHYHHTKTEKFLVIRGRARFGFRHIADTVRHYEI